MYAFLTNLTKLVLIATGWGPVTPEPRRHEGGSVPVMTFSPRW
ncbi:hypothetical protein [Aeromicrobium ginsengisoli]|nr:hypothetical protein [Aeromicrobium ginsengisoli]